MQVCVRSLDVINCLPQQSGSSVFHRTDSNSTAQRRSWLVCEGQTNPGGGGGGGGRREREKEKKRPKHVTWLVLGYSQGWWSRGITGDDHLTERPQAQVSRCVTVSVCVCVCVCIYECVCVCVCACACVRERARVCMNQLMSECVCVCVCARARAHVNLTIHST